jgi:hypothetical protein
LGRLPQHLFNDRLRDAVAARGPLSWSGDTTIPALKVDLLAFEQVFDSPTSSRGVVRARATVYHKGLIGQKRSSPNSQRQARTARVASRRFRPASMRDRRDPRLDRDAPARWHAGIDRAAGPAAPMSVEW